MNKLLLTAIFTATIISQTVFAATDPLVGKWKTIDDRTGFSLSDVTITKNKANQYTATIVDVRSSPGGIKQVQCVKCTGDNKGKPLIGLTTLAGLTTNPEKKDEFINGTLLDPHTGNIYPARARLGSNGKHLVIRGLIDGTSVGRNMTWIKY
ncbi:DUF2147 domain-containing protein [Acinetobacter chinensis]|uniref:DUF2147 domain-containing protein n=1 Tax=Acinetobacter chinensis TaxID=2004650 RepID=A0A3B7LYM3_9GAMM|nr:DUF2147 domain-containing protein [Acinetobacter chinensis]AXY55599.1 DUF2147 domain-containing protein [Acinetobacter chinensis]MDV2469633.1 DUF2147 domain-containing protein [Acinetobacter chinensis]